MKLRNLVFAGILAFGFATSASAEDMIDPIGRKAPPKAAISSNDGGVDATVLADIVREMRGEDTAAVVAFINDLYELKDKYRQVMEKEIELRQSHVSDEAQKKLMTEYIQLLDAEKTQAKKVIEVIERDLEVSESKLLQVCAKIHRIGDRMMKQTIGNIMVEVRKFVRYKLMNSQGQGRAFYVDAMRFMDQYFQG